MCFTFSFAKLWQTIMSKLEYMQTSYLQTLLSFADIHTHRVIEISITRNQMQYNTIDIQYTLSGLSCTTSQA